MDSYELLLFAAQTLDRMAVPDLVTGSMATITYGEARFTNDVDSVANFQLHHVTGLRESFPAPEFYCSVDAMTEAIRRRSQFTIIHPESGLKIDFMVPNTDPFNESRLNRGVSIVLDDQGNAARFASAEDAILKKLEYYRDGGSDKHVRDIRGVLLIQGDAVDFDYLNKWTDHPGVTEQLQQVLDI